MLGLSKSINLKPNGNWEDQVQYPDSKPSPNQRLATEFWHVGIRIYRQAKQVKANLIEIEKSRNLPPERNDKILAVEWIYSVQIDSGLFANWWKNAR